MTDNARLIEEAAKAIWDADTTIPETWDNKSVVEWDRNTYRGMARAALGVFEKAHTPTAHEVTTDEREAPDMDERGWADYADWRASRDPETGAPHWDWIDGYQAARRRSEVPEPNPLFAVIQDAYNAWHMESRSRAIEILHDALSDFEAPEPSAEHQEHTHARRADTMTLLSHSEPQGEPSDAPEAPVHYSSSEAFAWQAGWESRGSGVPFRTGRCADVPMPSEETLAEIENRVYGQYQNKIAGMAGALIREGWIAALRAAGGV